MFTNVHTYMHACTHAYTHTFIMYSDYDPTRCVAVFFYDGRACEARFEIAISGRRGKHQPGARRRRQCHVRSEPHVVANAALSKQRCSNVPGK